MVSEGLQDSISTWLLRGRAVVGADPRSLSNDTRFGGVSSPTRGKVALDVRCEWRLWTVFHVLFNGGDSRSAVPNDGRDADASRLRRKPRILLFVTMVGERICLFGFGVLVGDTGRAESLSEEVCFDDEVV